MSMAEEAPVAMDVRPDAVRLQWPEGVSELSAADLRAACRCGGCRAARLRGEPPTADSQIRLSSAAPVGQYAVQLIFADGHDRGIYPWALLRELSQPQPADGAPTTP